MATLFTFGCGSRGELGLPRADDRCRPEAIAVEFPQPVPCNSSGETDITAVALGTDHSLCVVGGRAFRWGLLCTRSPPRWSSGNSCGGEVVPSPAPVSAWSVGRSEGEGGSSDSKFDGHVRSVACGGSNSFMLTKDGEVFLFGDLRPPGGDAGHPRWLWGCSFKGAGERVVQIAAGWRHCLLLTEAGSLFALGDDEHGQCAGVNCGDIPVSLPTTQRAVGIAAGACHSVAWDSLGTAFTWGHGGCGRLGLGGSQHRRAPTQVDALQEPVCLASCGANFTLFATSHGRALWACGGNQYGQLGLGAASSASTELPRQLDLPRGSEEIISLSCGMHHALCLTRLAATPGQPMERSVVWAWGCAVSGQCGRAAGERRGSSPPQCRTAPEPLVDFLAPSPHWPLAVAAGRSHSAVLAQTHPAQGLALQTSSPVIGWWAPSATQPTMPSNVFHTGYEQSPMASGLVSCTHPSFTPSPASLPPPLDGTGVPSLHAASFIQNAADQDRATQKKIGYEDIIDEFCASLVPSTAPTSGHSSTRTAEFHLSSPTPQVLVHSPSQFYPDPPEARRLSSHPGGASSRAGSPLRSPPQRTGLPGSHTPSNSRPGSNTGLQRERPSRPSSPVALLVELGEAALRGEDEDEGMVPAQNGCDEKDMAHPSEFVWEETGMVRSASAAQLRTWNGKTYIHGGRSGKPGKMSQPPSRRVSMDLDDRRPKMVVTGVRGRATVPGVTQSQHGNTERKKQRWSQVPQSWVKSELRRSSSAVELQRSRSDGRLERYVGHGHGNGSNARASRRATKHELSHMQMAFGADGPIPGSPHDLFVDFPDERISDPRMQGRHSSANAWQAPLRTASPPGDVSAGRWPDAQPTGPPADFAVERWPAALSASPPHAESTVGRWPVERLTPQFAGADLSAASPLRSPFAAPRRDEWSGVRDSLNDLTSMIANMKSTGSPGVGNGLGMNFIGSMGGVFSNGLSADLGAGMSHGSSDHSRHRIVNESSDHGLQWVGSNVSDDRRHPEVPARGREHHDELRSSPKHRDDCDASDAGITFSQSESDAAASSRRSSAGSRRSAGGTRRQPGRRARAGRGAKKDAPRRAAARGGAKDSPDTAAISGAHMLAHTVTQPGSSILSTSRQPPPRSGMQVHEDEELCSECGSAFMPESNFCMKCGSKRHAKHGDGYQVLQDGRAQSMHNTLPAPRSEPRSSSEARFVDPSTSIHDERADHGQLRAAKPAKEAGLVHHSNANSSSSSPLPIAAVDDQEEELPTPTADFQPSAQEAEPFVMGSPLGRSSSKSTLGSEPSVRRKRPSPAGITAPQLPPSSSHRPRSSAGSNAGASPLASVAGKSNAQASAPETWDAKAALPSRPVAKQKGPSRTPSSASASSKGTLKHNARRKQAVAAAPRQVEPVKHSIQPARNDHMRSRLSSDNSDASASQPASPTAAATGPLTVQSQPALVAESAFVTSQILNVKKKQPRTPSVQSASSVDVSSHRSGVPEPSPVAQAAEVLRVQPKRQTSNSSSASSSSPSPKKAPAPAQTLEVKPAVLSADDDSSDDKEAVQPMVLSAHGSSSSGDDSPVTKSATARRMATAVPQETPMGRHIVQSEPRFVKPAADPDTVQSEPRFVKPRAGPAEDVVPFSDGESSGSSSSGGKGSLSPQQKLKVASVAAAAVAATTVRGLSDDDASSSEREVPAHGGKPQPAARHSSPSGSSTGGSSDGVPARGGKLPPTTSATLEPVTLAGPGSGSSSDADSSPNPLRRPVPKFAPAAPKPMASGPPVGMHAPKPVPPAGMHAPVTTMLESFSSGEDLDVEEM